MTKRIMLALTILLAFSVFGLSQTLTIKLGVFQPELNSDLWQINMINLVFDEGDMLDSNLSIEYEYFLNRILSFSLEGSTYYKAVYSMYRDYEYSDGSPIYQNLSLRITSLEFNAKLHPIGFHRAVSPYLGFGAGVYVWRYEQWGDFILFPEMYVEEGYAKTDRFDLGANLRAGVTVRISRRIRLVGEGKYQYLKGELSSYFEGFEKLDMSGLTIAAGIAVRLR